MFKDKVISIIGAGGLGGFVIEEVARLNPKRIIIIDGDKFSESNLNRQIYSSLDSIGEYKAQVAASVIERITKAQIEFHNEYLTKKNIELLKKSDIVFDCLDNIESKLMVSDYTTKNNIPLVHGAISSLFGEASLVLDKDYLKDIYKDKKEDKKPTTSFAVSTVASIQVAIAHKYFSNNCSDILGKLILIDLEDLSIKKINI